MVERFRLDAPWLADPSLGRVFDALAAVGEARVVGGAVRNTLLGEPLGDLDIATDVLPAEVARAGERAGLAVHETGLAHGTLTLVADGNPFEVTTLREDVSTDGRRATVRFTKDWANDAERRDFTMNALYAGRDGTGYDYVGGLVDCLARRVRFIGDADRRILEDHLRVLRFLRFHAAYGRGAPDREGLEAVRRHRARVACLAAERVQHEVVRLLPAPGAVDALAIIDAERLLRPFADIALDVAAFKALAEVCRSVGRPLPAPLGLVALASHDADGFCALANGLKLSKRATARGLDALAASARMPPGDDKAARAVLYDWNGETFADALVLAVARGAGGTDPARWLDLAQHWQAPRMPVSGGDLLAEGATSGPELGRRLARLERAWRDSDFALDREALLALDRSERTDAR